MITPAMLSLGLTLVKMTCVLVMALAVTLAMRRESAGARHLVWLVAFAALLALPALSAWAPVPVRVLPDVTAPAAPAAPVLDRLVGPSPASRLPVSNAAPFADDATDTPQRTTLVATPKPRPIGPGSLLAVAWGLGAALLLLRLAAGAWWIHRVVRRARVLDGPEWQKPLVELADRLGLHDVPVLLMSERVGLPFASGLLAPRIVLPAESTAWSAERRCAVLIHELAHVRRRDVIGHTASRVACALYWFHPLVWSAARRLRAESERACDDVAIELGILPSDYAEHLLDIATQVRVQTMPAVALAMANPNEFEGRMLAILNPLIRRRGLGRARTAWLVGSLAALALVVGTISPAPRASAKERASAPTASAEAPRTAMTTNTVQQTISRAVTATSSRISHALQTSLGGHDLVAAATDIESSDGDAGEGENSGESKGEAEKRVAILSRSLRGDSSPEVRRVAAWGLERYADSDAAAQALAAAATSDDDDDVREMAVWGLAQSHGHVAAVLEAFHDKTPSVRQTAAWAAGSIGDISAVPALAGLLGDADADTRELAAWSIGSCGPEHAPATLVRLLSDANPSVRLSAAWALREIGDPASADEIESALRREKDTDVSEGLIRALGAMGDRAIGTLTTLVDSGDPKVRAVVITALAGGQTGGPWPWPRPQPRPFP